MTLKERANIVINMCNNEIKRQEVFMNLAEKRDSDKDWIMHYELQGLYMNIRDILNGKMDLELEDNSEYEHEEKNTNKDIKHGHWVLLDNCSNHGVYCSVCNKKVYKDYYGNVKVTSKFCPNCGAIMDEEFERL